MVADFLCKIGIHSWSKWDVKEAMFEIIPLGIIYPSSIRGKRIEVDGYFHLKECKNCGKKKSYSTEKFTGERI